MARSPQDVFEAHAAALANGDLQAEDALLLRWSASSRLNHISDAVDTFVFDQGLIRRHSTVFRAEPVSTG